MASPVLIAKAAVAVVSDERLRKGVGWALVAIFSPVIVVIALLCSLGAGAAEHNVSIAELCFNGGTIPDTISEEYRVYIVDMQNSLSLLDGYITEINEQTEDGASLDAILSDGKLFEQETANYLSDRREKKQHKVGKQHRWSKEMANCKGEQIPP